MTRLTMKKMQAKNFKGFKDFEIEFSPTRTDVYGDNGTGKSSIADAFTWLFFGKDSKGNASGTNNFVEKPLDDKGQIIPKLTTEVTIVFEDESGKEKSFSRVQSEKWQRKRGSADEVFTGNMTEYVIDGTKVSQSKFQEAVGEIAPFDLFQLLTNLGAFNRLHWKEKRNWLIDISGIDASPLDGDYGDEVNALIASGENIEQWLNSANKQLRDDLKALDAYPVRIDEAKRSLVLNGNGLNLKEEDLSKEIATLTLKLAELSNSGGEQEKRAIAEKKQLIQNEINRISAQIAKEHDERRKALQDEQLKADASLNSALTKKRGEVANVQACMFRLDNAQTQLNDKRREYLALRNSPIGEPSEQCPTCGQALPDEAIAKAKQALTDRRVAELRAIQSNGETLAAMYKVADDALKNAQKRLADIEQETDALQKAHDEAAAKLLNYPALPDYSQDAKLEQLRREFNSLVEKEKSGNGKDDVLVEKANVQAAIMSLQGQLASVKQGKEAEKRIEELEAERKAKGAEIAKAEQAIEQAKRCVQDRNTRLESELNAMFEGVQWRLFDEAINGNVMVEVDGGAIVNYETANTASQIKADIEIIKYLSDKTGVKLPLMVDNKERVNRLPDIDTQLITLSVSADKDLRIVKQ